MANKARVRDDSMLNTGLSSAVERKRYAKQEELHNKRIAEKEAMRVSLTTQGETIMQWIDQEIKDASDLRKMILNVDSEENVRAQLLARQLHLTFLQNAKTRVKKYLKEPKVEQKESFSE
jgi:phosphoribosylpyrophosphate synthetase